MPFLSVRHKKNSLILRVCFFQASLSLLFISFVLAQTGEENISISTYYPSPYGIYEDLQVDRISVNSPSGTPTFWNNFLVQETAGGDIMAIGGNDEIASSAGEVSFRNASGGARAAIISDAIFANVANVNGRGLFISNAGSIVRAGARLDVRAGGGTVRIRAWGGLDVTNNANTQHRAIFVRCIDYDWTMFSLGAGQICNNASLVVIP